MAVGPATHAAGRDWGVPPFEPLSIRTADFEPVQVDDLVMTAHADRVHGARAGRRRKPGRSE